MSPSAENLNSRWSPAAFERRRLLELSKRSRDEPYESDSWRHNFCGGVIIERILRATGLYAYGSRNFMQPVVSENTFVIPSLPTVFDGFRLLHLSDTHFDLAPALAGVVMDMVKSLKFDACVMTGDFRDRLTTSGDRGVDLVVELVRSLSVPTFACLGNHDLARDVPLLESAPMSVLINENSFIERAGERLFFCGVDDFGYYATDDFDSAFAGIPAGAVKVLLSHDPAAYGKAGEHDATVMLSGHTHGGQMCIPGGLALVSHSRCARRMIAGAWKYGDMQGYTSMGVGGSRVAARFFCKGELVIHTLRRPNE